MSFMRKRMDRAHAERLLEAGRKRPPLRYDVERGLAQHEARIGAASEVPAWASAPRVIAGSGWIVKALTGLGLIAVVALGIRAWPKAPPRAAAVVELTPTAATVEVVNGRSASPEPPPPPAAVPGAPARQREVVAPAPEIRRGPHLKTQEHKLHREPPPSAAPVPSLDASAAPRATSTPDAQPRPRPRAPSDADEIQQLAAAERALESAPERALALTREGDRRFADGYLQEERNYVAIMALSRLGRSEEARSQTTRFFKRYPQTPYRARVEQALAAAPK